MLQAAPPSEQLHAEPKLLNLHTDAFSLRMGFTWLCMEADGGLARSLQRTVCFQAARGSWDRVTGSSGTASSRPAMLSGALVGAR